MDGVKSRAENQRIALFVKELIKLSGRRRPHFLGKNVEKFKGRGLDVTIAIARDLFMQKTLHRRLFRLLFPVNIPHAFRRMYIFLLIRPPI